MKTAIKSLVLFLAAFFILSPPFAFAAGDVNGDGAVDLKDAIAALQVIVNVPTAVTTSGDINNDNRIGIEEALVVMRSIAQGFFIYSIVPSVMQPGSLVTITGYGFDPTDCAISVNLIKIASSYPLVVPVVAATTDMIQFVAPPLIDESTIEFSGGNVEVQVVQVSGTHLKASNILSGSSIQALPLLESVTPGEVSKAYVTAALELIDDMQQVVFQSSEFTEMVMPLNDVRTNLEGLLSAIQDVLDDPGQTPDLTTTLGGTVDLDTDSLAAMDRLIAGVIFQFMEQVEPELLQLRMNEKSIRADGGCSYNTGNPFIDGQICSFKNYHQDLHTTGQEAVALGASIEIGAYLSILGSFASAAAVIGGAANSTITAMELMWSTASSYINTYATNTTTPPPFQTLADLSVGILEKVASTGGLLSMVYNAHGLSKEYDRIIQQKSDPSSISRVQPQNGFILSSPLSAFSETAAKEVLYSSKNGDVPIIQDIVVPEGRGIIPLEDAMTDPPAGDPPYSLLVSQWGNGTGTVNVSPSGGDCNVSLTGCSLYDTGAQASLTAVPDDGCFFEGWSGACSGTGACEILMNSNQSVSATFSKIIELYRGTLYYEYSDTFANDPGWIPNPYTVTGTIENMVVTLAVNGSLLNPGIYPAEWMIGPTLLKNVYPQQRLVDRDPPLVSDEWIYYSEMGAEEGPSELTSDGSSIVSTEVWFFQTLTGDLSITETDVQLHIDHTEIESYEDGQSTSTIQGTLTRQ